MSIHKSGKNADYYIFFYPRKHIPTIKKSERNLWDFFEAADVRERFG